MSLIRKIKQIGNSFGFIVPSEIFGFLGFDPNVIRYKFIQDETAAVFIVILEQDVIAFDEKKFLIHRGSYNVIVPKTLCTMWNIGLKEGQNRVLKISYDDSPYKWRIQLA